MEDRIRHICVAVQKAVCELMDVDRFYVMLYYSETRQVTFPWVWNGKKDQEISWAERAWDGRWFPDQSVLQNRSVRLDGEGQYWPEDEELPKSRLAMPIAIGENLRMVLVIENWRRGDVFSDEAEHFLATIAQQVAMTIRNVQLFDGWQESEDKRRAAEKMATVSIFAGELAHSLNNLAGAIPVRTRLGRRELDRNDSKQAKAAHQFDEIEKATIRLLDQANKLREITQPRARDRLKINDMIEIALKRALASQPSAEERIAIRTSLIEDMPRIEAERDSFIDVLTSIITNGLESIPERGELNIATRRIREAGKEIVEIEISDTGIGIPEGNIEKIFDPFFTTKDTGMGFGLWRDRSIIREINGRIDVKSELSKGSTFTISLPVGN